MHGVVPQTLGNPPKRLRLFTINGKLIVEKFIPR